MAVPIEQDISAVAQTSASSTDLTTNKRSIKTTVLVANDSMLVLGGLAGIGLEWIFTAARNARWRELGWIAGIVVVVVEVELAHLVAGGEVRGVLGAGGRIEFPSALLFRNNPIRMNPLAPPR